MTEDKAFRVADQRMDENLAGAFQLEVDNELMTIYTGGGGIHRITIFREEDARRLYRQLGRLFNEEGETE